MIEAQPNQNTISTPTAQALFLRKSGGSHFKRTILVISTVVLGGFILIGSLYFANKLIKENQDIRQQASTDTGTATVNIAPTSAQLNTNGSQTFSVSFNPQNNIISGISVRLQYPIANNQSLITPATPVAIVTQSDPNWNCPVTTTEIGATLGTIDVGCLYLATTGFTGQIDVPLFTVNITAGTTVTTSPITLSFDPTQTVITRKSDNEDVAAIPQATANITIVEALTPTPTVTATPTVTPTGTISVTPTMTVTGTPPAAPSATPSVTPTGTISVTPTMTVTGTPPAAPSATPSVTPALSSTPTPTRSVAASPTPTFRASATNTPTPVNAACNSYCATNRDCGNSLVCYNGQCRDERCPNDSSCSCQDYDPTSVTGSTQLPDSGSISQTVFNLLLGSSLIIGSGSMLLTHLRRKE